jgi:hypothetical protein
MGGEASPAVPAAVPAAVPDTKGGRGSRGRRTEKRPFAGFFSLVAGEGPTPPAVAHPVQIEAF